MKTILEGNKYLDIFSPVSAGPSDLFRSRSTFSLASLAAYVLAEFFIPGSHIPASTSSLLSVPDLNRSTLLICEVFKTLEALCVLDISATRACGSGAALAVLSSQLSAFSCRAGPLEGAICLQNCSCRAGCWILVAVAGEQK